MHHNDEDEDEEILSDFSLDEHVSSSISDEEDLVTSSKSKKSKKDSSAEPEKKSRKSKKSAFDAHVAGENGGGGDFDFLAMIDAAYSSGKLTEMGLELSDGEEGHDFDLDGDDDSEHQESFNNVSASEGEEYLSDGSETVSDEDAIESEDSPSGSTQTTKPALTPSATAWRPKSLMMKTNDDSKSQPQLSDASARLLKQIQSHVNKLSSANLCTIAGELEAFFSLHRRKEVIEMITETLMAQLTRPGGNLLDAFAVNFAALTVLLYWSVGVEFGAHVLESLISLIDSFSQEAKDSDGSLQSHAERSLINCIAFVSFLYDLGFCSAKLVTDLIEEAANRLSEIDVEVILKLFKMCGQKLRKENPDFMKYIVGKLRANSNSNNSNVTSNMRFKFMIEQIDELQGSKKKLAEAFTSADDLTAARKAIKSFSQARGKLSLDPLQITLSDVRDISVKGKWWLVGSSWLGNSISSKAEEERDKKSSTNNNSNNNTIASTVAELAKKHHMNTEVRRAVFSAIVSSEDPSEAFASLLSLRLAGKQEREIILVLLHCAASERRFNPFYLILAGKLAAHARSFMMTLQFCLWDSLKSLSEWSLRKCANMARLFGGLIGQGVLPLSVLRKANWIRLSAVEQAFWQLLLKALLDEATATTCTTNDSENDQLERLVSGLLSILQQRNDSSTAGKHEQQQQRKVTLLTANTNLSAFEDDFFNTPSTASGQHQPVSQEKWQECRSLRDGLVYFLDLFCVKMSSDGLPFGEGVEAFKEGCLRFRRLLSPS